MTIRSSRLYKRAHWVYRTPLLRRAANRVSLGLSWLSPVQSALSAPLDRNLNAMLQTARGARAEGADHMEFMLHSSELMPGGSPTFRTASDIERLYESLEILFQDLSSWCRGATLKEFHARFENSPAAASGTGNRLPDRVDDPGWKTPDGIEETSGMAGT